MCPWHNGAPVARGGRRRTRPGIYAVALTEEEAARWAQVPVGSLDSELRLARLRLARVAAAEQRLLAGDPSADTKRLSDQIDHQMARRGAVTPPLLGTIFLCIQVRRALLHDRRLLRIFV